MKRNLNLAEKIWEIAYPVLMYYVAITIGSFVAQIIFGTGIENYMLCKIIGSIVAIPVVFADYKTDLMMTGRYGMKKVYHIFCAATMPNSLPPRNTLSPSYDGLTGLPFLW